MLKIEFLNDNYTSREIITISNAKALRFFKDDCDRLNNYSFYLENIDKESIVEFKYSNRPFIRVIGDFHDLYQLCIKLAKDIKFSRFEYSEYVYAPNGKLQTKSERTVWTR